MLRRVFVFVCLAAATNGVTACARRDARERLDARVAAASQFAAAQLAEWLGPGRSPLTVRPDANFVDSRGSMTIESHVAYEYGRERFRHLIADEAFVGDGIAWYLQSRIVENAFNVAFRQPGYRHHTVCFFGCHVPWSIRSVITSRWSDGVARGHFLREESRRLWPTEAPSPVDARAVRIALLLASLERELGWPTLQGALRVAAHARGDQRFADILERAAARDVKTAFAMALGAPTDYRLAGYTVTPGTCQALPCHTTRVTFSKTAEVPYPLALIVEFEGGAMVVEHWRGEPTIDFESATPPTAARLDPDRHWLLDVDYANNLAARTQPSSEWVVKWVARWAVWLQDAMLLYTFPI
jgi:hypothetical protein